MSISSTGGVSTALAQASTGDAVATLVLKKTLELQAQNAAQLIAALPSPASSNNPPHLGNSVDTTA